MYPAGIASVRGCWIAVNIPSACLPQGAALAALGSLSGACVVVLLLLLVSGGCLSQKPALIRGKSWLLALAP